jgi:hypothetical protein
MDLFGIRLLHAFCPLRSRARQQGVVAIAIVRKILRPWRGRALRLGLPVCGSLLLAGLLFLFGSAVAASTDQSAAALSERSVPANGACPSAKFAEFLQAFSRRPALQRRYTRFPLEFGLEDLSHLGDADEGFKIGSIYSFEKMPNYDPESGTVFPTPIRIKKFGLKTEITTIKNSKSDKDKNVFPEEIIRDPAIVTVLVTLPDSGVLVFYRFRKMQGCWFLYAVSDRST